MPGRAGILQRGVHHIEPSRAVATVVHGLLSVGLIGAVGAGLLLRSDSWPPAVPRPSSTVPDWAILAGTGLAVLLIASAVVNGRRWRTMRQIVRLSRDPALGPALPPGQVVTSGPFVRTPPPLRVQIVRPPRFRQRPGPLRRVTETSNVLGRPPLSIVYLRVFENQPRARTFVRGAWREFGHVHLLRSAAAMSPAQFRAVRRAGALGPLFVSSPEDLRTRLDRAPTEPQRPGWHRLDTVAGSTVWAFDRFGAYPVHSVFCHADFWQTALDHLLARADLVVLDLSGYRTKNKGTQYELQRIVDTYPVSRVVLLADPWSNVRYLEGEVRAAWQRMDVRSPNARLGSQTVPLALTDYYLEVETQPAGRGGPAPTQTLLKASRAQSRWLLARAHRVLEHAPRHLAPAPAVAPVSTSPPYAGSDHGHPWEGADPVRRVPWRGGLAAATVVVASAAAVWLATSGLSPSGVPASVAGSYNVREGPSTGSGIIGTVGPGDPLVVVCVTDDWAQLEQPLPGGFVSTQQMTFAESPPRC